MARTETIKAPVPWQSEPVEFEAPTNFECKACGCMMYRVHPMEGDHALQIRCAKCNKWHSNAKYDSRPKLEKIAEAVERSERIECKQ
ncbi:MAG: hypothetical protein FWG30_11545 [Eubacteriaceae bacterium]|nr:hypothetical protein [Eubacteriaceae bacterium]